MYRLITITLIFLLFAIANAQNNAPQVSNVVAVADTQNRVVTITYDLSDVEQDSIKIDLRISGDSGTTYLLLVDSTAGDIGYPILPGINKQITWQYEPGLIKLSDQTSNCFRAKIIADDLYEIDIQEIVNRVDSLAMRQDLQAIEGVRHFSANPTAWAATKTFIENKFIAHNLQARRHEFSYSNVTGANIIGRHPGHTEEEKTYIVDGHFDTVSSTPGADDNGSGTVGMLEAMRVLSGYQFARTVVFIGFDLEEVGLVGSQRYVSEAIPHYQQTEGVFNFEMIGYTCHQAGCDAFRPLGNYIHNIYDVNSSSLRVVFDQAAAAYVPGLVVLSTQATPDNPNCRRSDHARFWDAGIKALFLTDGANFRNPHYHQPGDNTTTLDYTFMTNVVKTTVATVAKLAGVRHSGVGLSNFFDLNVTSTSQGPPNQVNTFVLKQNFPNPFNPGTTIEYTLEKSSEITLKIFNLLGEEIRILANKTQAAGTHRVIWDGRNNTGKRVTSGVYVYKIEVDSQLLAKKMVMLR